ncbi:Uncharacterised protein [Aeromonas encheleia]|nr:Uncharacterised protein [Aeromonas encheleia]
MTKGADGALCMFPAETNVPFLVMNRYPAGGVVLLGGVVVPIFPDKR